MPDTIGGDTVPDPTERYGGMNPHVHISATHLVASIAATVAIFGTLHLLALGADNRASRAFIALGF